MKKYLLFYSRIAIGAWILLCGSAALYGQPQFQWATKVGGYQNDWGIDLETDSFGNVYTLGIFAGTVDFDPGPDTFNLTGGGLYILKQNALGNFVWAIGVPGAGGYDISNALTIDDQANIYVTGKFSGTVDFDPGPGLYDLSTPQPGDISFFVAKYNDSGDLQWAVQAPGGPYNKLVKDIEVDKEDGSIYITGDFADTIDFDPGPSTSNLYSGNAWRTFIWKLNPSGNYLWAKFFEGGTNWVSGIELQGKKILVGGEFGDTVDFDPGLGTSWGSSDSGQIFVCRLSAAGNLEWLHISGLGGSVYATAFTSDAYGNSYISGPYFGNPDFAPGPAIVNLSDVPSSQSNTYLSKISADGSWLWSKDLIAVNDSIGNSNAWDIDVGSDGALYSAGVFFNQADFDPGSATAPLTATNNTRDAFISKLDSSGNYQWAIALGGATSSDYGMAIRADATGNVYTTGIFQSYVDFDPGAANYVLNGNGQDAFVQKLSQCDITFSDLNISVCNTFSLAGQTFNTDGDYVVVIPNSANCDSIISFHLSIQPIDISVTQHGDTLWSNAVNAGSYQWINCDSNNAPVLGATGQAFVPAITGNYAVVVTLPDCRDTSLCYPVTRLDIAGIAASDSRIQVFPNPCREACNVILSRALYEAHLSMTDVSGKVIWEKGNVSGNSIRISMSGFSKGVYFLSVKEQGAVFRTKIVKQ